jgi:hypothetical protein
MEEAQYKLRRIQDELEYYLMKTPAADVALDDLDPSLSVCRVSGRKPASAGWLTGEVARLDQNNPAALG